jgi:hypothetical protein
MVRESSGSIPVTRILYRLFKKYGLFERSYFLLVGMYVKHILERTLTYGIGGKENFEYGLSTFAVKRILKSR